jgi:integrase
MRLPDEDVGRLRKYVTEGEVQRLLTATNETEDPTRNRALILIAYRHGLRVSELVSLTWSQDVDLQAGRLLIRRLKRGRSGVHRLLPDELELLTKLRTRAVNDWVFPGRHGRLTRSAVNRMLKDVGRSAGLPNIHPHALRHACGYELAMKGVDTRRLQIFLGHRSITSTTMYTDLAEHATDSVWGCLAF